MKLATVSTWIGVVALGLVAVACDKPGEDAQKKKDEAQLQLTQAQMEATQKVDKAQAAADQKIQVASADFQKSVADYRTSRQKDLADIDKQIADLTTADKTATGKKKTDLDAALPGIRAQRDAFVRQMNTLDTANAATFDGAKMSLDKSLDDLKAAISKAS
jgi:hypothetical protein